MTILVQRGGDVDRPSCSSSPSVQDDQSDTRMYPRLLDKLQAPRPANSGRKRYVHANPPPVWKKPSQWGEGAYGPCSARTSKQGFPLPPSISVVVTRSAWGRVVVVEGTCNHHQLQPSECERAFSILNRSFGDQQHNSLEDNVKGTVMLQFNKCWYVCQFQSFSLFFVFMQVDLGLLVE